MAMAPRTFRLHKHMWIEGPNARRAGSHEFEHSHEGGDVPHTHANTGPSYSRGHRRSRKPKGPQLDGYRATPRDELIFDVVITRSAQLRSVPDHVAAADSVGGMVGARLESEFGLIPRVRFEP